MGKYGNILPERQEMLTAEFFVRFGLFARRNFLGDGLCDELQHQMDTAPESPSTVAEETMDAIDEAIRKSVSARVSEQTRSLVHARMLSQLPTLAEYFDVALNGCQMPQFLRYRVGDYFRPHADFEAVGPEYVTQRRISVVVFLSRESTEPEPGTYGGGRLTFFGLMADPRVKSRGFPLVGEKGLLIAFRSDLVHSVTPITHGERSTIVSWYY